MYRNLESLIRKRPLAHKRVFLRVDANIDLAGRHIESDFRLRAFLPTLKLLIKEKAKVILATHIGRSDKDPSTRVLQSWLEAQGICVVFEHNLEKAEKISHAIESGSLLLLENLRYFDQETRPSAAFARLLASLADYYVNDAWGVSHRSDSSLTLVPELFNPANRAIGLLIQRELEVLRPVKDAPLRPSTLVLGGGKIADKLGYLYDLLDYADTLLVGPALCFTLMHAQGKTVGRSLVDTQSLQLAQRILTKAKRDQLVLPTDFLYACGNFAGPLQTAAVLPPDAYGITLGPESVEHYTKIIRKSKTIVANGLMGFLERPETLGAYHTLLQSICQSDALSIVGGGESITAVYTFGLEDAVTFCSTGGGSTLAYLAHHDLPGLASFRL